MDRFIAIDNVCAWPNLTLTADGDILAAIFNQPCHGAWEGDVECWGSADGGRSWQLRGTAAAHRPGTNRMNVAAGLAGNGDLIVVASGWTHRPTRAAHDAGQTTPFGQSQVLEAWTCRSSDGGRTWSKGEDGPGFPGSVEPQFDAPIPFGDVVIADDGSLCVPAYGGRWSERGGANSAYLYRSRDDGRSWGEGVLIGAGDHNETAPLHLGGGRWLAACRTRRTQELQLFTSSDDGRSWRFDQALSLPMQHPAHLLRLKDGRVLLTYGNRAPGQFGIDLRLSADAGRTWSVPYTLVALERGDLGYPATVQRPDGTLVTAYYSSGIAPHGRYHMGVALWQAEEVLGQVPG